MMDLYHSALQDYREHRVEEAIGKLQTVIFEDPTFEDAYEALSVIFYNQKRYDEGIEILKKWITINPNTIMSHTNLSRCYVAKGMIAEAEHEQNEARKLTWKAELKTKKQEMPKVDYEDRIRRFKQVIELDPADVLGYFSLGSAYLESGKKREAVDTFEKAVDVDPMHSSSYLGWGSALEAIGDKGKAKQVYLKGIKVADERGDMMTQKKMESRLRALENPTL
jgi:tetratricopeptide (TPR) repeat protein